MTRTNWTHSSNFSPRPATQPGQIDGTTFTCPRQDCPDQWTTSDSGARDYARSHGRWHDAQDRARQPFASMAGRRF